MKFPSSQIATGILADKGLLALGTQPERSPKLPLFRFVSPPSKSLEVPNNEVSQLAGTLIHTLQVLTFCY